MEQKSEMERNRFGQVNLRCSCSLQVMSSLSGCQGFQMVSESVFIRTLGQSFWSPRRKRCTESQEGHGKSSMNSGRNDREMKMSDIAAISSRGVSRDGQLLPKLRGGPGIRYAQVAYDVRKKDPVDWQVGFLIKSSTKSGSFRSLNTELVDKISKQGHASLYKQRQTCLKVVPTVLGNHTYPVEGFWRPHYEGSRGNQDSSNCEGI